MEALLDHQQELTALEQLLAAQVNDLPFFQMYIEKIRTAPITEWPELLDEFEELLDLDLFSWNSSQNSKPSAKDSSASFAKKKHLHLP